MRTNGFGTTAAAGMALAATLGTEVGQLTETRLLVVLLL